MLLFGNVSQELDFKFSGHCPPPAFYQPLKSRPQSPLPLPPLPPAQIKSSGHLESDACNARHRHPERGTAEITKKRGERERETVGKNRQIQRSAVNMTRFGSLRRVQRRGFVLQLTPGIHQSIATVFFSDPRPCPSVRPAHQTSSDCEVA